MLVVIHSGARERRHGFALGAAYEQAHLLRSMVLDVARMDQQAVRDVDVAKIFGNLSRAQHGAAHDRYFSPVFLREFKRELDAMDGRGKARDEKPSRSPREHLVKFAAHRTLTGRVTRTLYVGGILHERQHAIFAVLGEAMQVKEAIVCRRGINFKVAGVNHHSERCVNRQSYTIHQTMSDLYR